MFTYPYQDQLCEAIDKQLVVELRYKDDIQNRTFNPYWVYRSTTGKILVGGWQVYNPNKREGNSYHKFELRLIKSLVVTKTGFDVQPNIPITRPDDCTLLICGLNGY